jgi:putative spermidine/putrescine transport system ATP-binding protein
MTALARGTRVTLERCAKMFTDGTRALEALDLEIAAGETLVFLGPSGCGKTTTLRIIAGLESPDPGGRVLFDGEDVTAQPIEDRNVGMVFQSYALFPNLDVAGNIAYGLKIRKLAKSDIARRLAEMLDMMQIRDLKDRKIDQLSGGQRQRVALARALAVYPRVLLLDEPLTALDAHLRERLRADIDALLRELGVTAVYVTHDQAEAMALGDRIIVMDHGVVAQAGTPREIYFNPGSRYVARFVGTMNRLAGRAENGCLSTAFGALTLRADHSGEMTVFFRPESARVVDAAEGDLVATVENAFFLGDRTRLILAGKDNQRLTVDTSGPREYRVGETMGLSIDPASLLALEN